MGGFLCIFFPAVFQFGAATRSISLASSGSTSSQCWDCTTSFQPAASDGWATVTPPPRPATVIAVTTSTTPGIGE